ncbi:MAG: DUF3343 domain-containing protein [Clostridia bacterium]|jgi:hypothetical protein|nr:DUF3343 domain-containing protein [Clostridia bacterium]
MEFIIVAFRSRTHTVAFSEYLLKRGISNEIVNTPKEAGVGCGLSVKISPSKFPMVRQATFKVGYNSFAGFFSVKHLAGKRVVRSI